MTPQPEHQMSVSPAQADAWARLWRILLTPRAADSSTDEGETHRMINQTSRQSSEETEHNPAS